MKPAVTRISALALAVFIPELAHAGPTVNLEANFRLFGEVERFGLGYGNMDIHFGTNVPPGGLATDIGGMSFAPGGAFAATGVLAPLNLPSSGFSVVDISFSVPFTMQVGQPSSMYIGLGDSGNTVPNGGGVQVIFDFSDNISYGGSILGTTPGQGLNLTSITMQDGTPLADAGLQFNFIPQNTVLTAAASSFDSQGVGTVFDTETAPTPAAVFLTNAAATSKLMGAHDGFSGNTSSLADLDVSPEPNPFTFDLAEAVVAGTDNVELTTITPIPEPSAFVMIATGLPLALGYSIWRRRRTTA